MQAIGFATQFYTLWDIKSEPIYTTIFSASGEKHVKTGEKMICTYLKNVSKDLDKVKQLYPDLEIIEDLRGKTSSFEYEMGYSRIEYADDVFGIGYLRGQAIATCNDARSLQWSYDNEHSAERIANISARLNELGYILVGYTWLTNSEYEAKMQAEKAELEIKQAAEKIYNQFYNTGTFNIQAHKNLSGIGTIHIDGVRVYFPDFKKCYYNDFAYGLPTIKGVGKKIKGKTLELVVSTKIVSLYVNGEDSEPENVKALVVESFKISK